MENIKEHNNLCNIGRIVSVNISTKKGVKKTPIEEGQLVENWGLKGDVHAETGIRQISLLAYESIQKQKTCPKINKDAADGLKPGDFAENITTSGLELPVLKIGQQIKAGKEAIIEITKIGKECHRYCAIYKTVGDCIMPREGIFAKVIKSGKIKTNDALEII